MLAWIRKVIWLSITDRVPSGRGEFKPMEIPLATFEVKGPLRKLGEEATIFTCTFILYLYEKCNFVGIIKLKF